MWELLPFVVFGIAFVALVVFMLRRDRARAAAAAERLTVLGFSSCAEEAATILETVTWLENNREYSYDIELPMRATLGREPAYYYRKSRRRQGQVTVSEELMVPLKRPSEAGLVLIVKPSRLSSGLATRLIGALATGPWDSQPDDLAKIEVPPDLSGTNLIGALGPAGTHLYDLVDSETMAYLQDAGDCGAMTVTCRGELCTLSSPSRSTPFDVPRLWRLIGAIPSR